MGRPALKLAGIAFALAASTVVAEPKVTASAHGDAKKGEAIYARCGACHALTYDRTGPHHCGLFGRHAGSVKDFAYSDAMRHSKIVWNEKTLDRFIANPLKTVPGTSMGYVGIADQQERTDLIAFLLLANNSALCGK